MGAINYGNQIIIFDYKNAAQGKSFNRLLRGIAQPGIYSGGLVTDAGAGVISIGTFIAWLNVDTDKAIAVQTSTAVLKTVPTTDTDYVLTMTYTWSDVDDNWLDFNFRLTGDSPATNEVIIATVNHASVGGVTSVSYTLRDYGLIDSSKNLYALNKIFFGKELDTELYRYTADTLYTPDVFKIGNTSNATTGLNGALRVAGGASIEKDLIVSGVIYGTLQGALNISSTADSTDKDTGCVVLEGGLGLEKNITSGQRVRAKGFSDKIVELTHTTTGILDLDWAAGRVFKVNANSAITGITFSNTGVLDVNYQESMVVYFKRSSVMTGIIDLSFIDFSYDTPPSYNNTVSTTSAYQFFTIDGGTKVGGTIVGTKMYL